MAASASGRDTLGELNTPSPIIRIGDELPPAAAVVPPPVAAVLPLLDDPLLLQAAHTIAALPIRSHRHWRPLREKSIFIIPSSPYLSASFF
jgi:hypothetical protein